LEFKTKCHPTAGPIPDLDQNSEPGMLSRKEENHLRSLACKLAEMASESNQREKRDLWYKHNKLEKTRPLSLVFPENSWFEIMNVDQLKVKDPFWRQWEWYFKHLIYRHYNIMDDFVIEPDLYVTPVFRTGDWGMTVEYAKHDARGSYSWDPPIKDERDIEKLKIPDIEIDKQATKQNLDVVNQMFGDILPVKIDWNVRTHENIIGEVTTFRGIQQVMMDMYDRPSWLHELLNFFTEAALAKIKYVEDNGFLSLNNRNHFVDSGGLGYSDELPAKGFDGKKVRLCDMWGHFAAQEMSGVSPAQHEEFALQYQLRVMERFGLNAYGCCEPYTNKFDMLKKIPRLRRVSVSPWCDVQVAAQKLEDKYIYSWKPNPAILLGNFDTEQIRKYVRNTLEIAEGCILEIILKDTITIDNDPERIKTWSTIVREEIERI
jgi:hypothetical protein